MRDAPTDQREPVLSGHTDGFCLTFGFGVVDVFPDYEGASAGFKAAKWAIAELEMVLAEGMIRRLQS